jgi:hypothetical protein
MIGKAAPRIAVLRLRWSRIKEHEQTNLMNSAQKSKFLGPIPKIPRVDKPLPATSSDGSIYGATSCGSRGGLDQGTQFLHSLEICVNYCL